MSKRRTLIRIALENSSGGSVLPPAITCLSEGEHALETLRSLWSRSSGSRSNGDGRLLLVLQGQLGLHRMTVRLEPHGLEIHAGADLPSSIDDDTPVAIVQGALADWERFVAAASGQGLDRLKIYGDTGVLVALGQRLSPEAQLWGGTR